MARLKKAQPAVHKLLKDFLVSRVTKKDGKLVYECPEVGPNGYLGLDFHMNSSEEVPGYEPLPETVMLGPGTDEIHKFRELCAGPKGAKAGDHGAWAYELQLED